METSNKDKIIWMGIASLFLLIVISQVSALQLGQASASIHVEEARTHFRPQYPFQSLIEPAPMIQHPALDLEHTTKLLVDALVQIESAGNTRLVGGSGERGIMQVMPGTWKELTRELYGEPISFDHAFDAVINRRVGTFYLSTVQKFLYENKTAWKSDVRALICACYNAGPGAVAKAGFDVKALPASVQDYAERAGALHDWYLASDAPRLQALLEQTIQTSAIATDSAQL